MLRNMCAFPRARGTVTGFESRRAHASVFVVFSPFTVTNQHTPGVDGLYPSSPAQLKAYIHPSGCVKEELEMTPVPIQPRPSSREQEVLLRRQPQAAPVTAFELGLVGEQVPGREPLERQLASYSMMRSSTGSVPSSAARVYRCITGFSRFIKIGSLKTPLLQETSTGRFENKPHYSHTGLGSSSLVSHVLHYPPPPTRIAL